MASTVFDSCLLLRQGQAKHNGQKVKGASKVDADLSNLTTLNRDSGTLTERGRGIIVSCLRLRTLQSTGSGHFGEKIMHYLGP